MYKCKDINLNEEILIFLKSKELIDSFEFNFTPTEQMVADMADNSTKFYSFYSFDFVKISKKYPDTLFKYENGDDAISYLNGKIKYELKHNAFKFEEDYEKAKVTIDKCYTDAKENGKLALLI